MTLKNLTLSIHTFLLLVSVNLMAQDGVLDNSFGVNGIVRTDINNLYDVFNAFAIQADGKIIVVGHTSSGSTANKESIIVRYNPNGSRDTSFGVNGIITAAYSSAFDTLNAVELQPDGKIVVGGYSGLDFVLARYTSSGQLDASFGTNGVVFTNYYSTVVGSSQDRINCIVIQSDGKILVGGFASYFNSCPLTIARYNTNGTLDSSFGVGGKTLIEFTTLQYSGNREIFDMAITPTGKIYAVGKAEKNSSATRNDQIIVRFNSNGSLDTGFGNNGSRVFDLGTESSFNEIKFQNDGKMVVVGNKNQSMTLVRLLENATPDLTFGTDGRVFPPLSSLGVNISYGKSVSIQPDGKIIISGYVYGTHGYETAIIRYLPNGTLDSTFANGGIFDYSFGSGFQDGGFSALAPNGMLIVGGNVNDNNIATDLFLYRISASALSTSDFSSSNFISYPNPVKDILYIETAVYDHVTYELYSVDGKKVETLPARNLSNGIVGLDVSFLAKGVYILKAMGGNIPKVIRIVKE